MIHLRLDDYLPQINACDGEPFVTPNLSDKGCVQCLGLAMHKRPPFRRKVVSVVIVCEWLDGYSLHLSKKEYAGKVPLSCHVAYATPLALQRLDRLLKKTEFDDLNLENFVC